MTFEMNIAEIRTALSTLLALHAQDNMSRADLRFAADFIEKRCDELAARQQPAGGQVILPVMTLGEVVSRFCEKPRPAMRLVSGQGGAA